MADSFMVGGVLLLLLGISGAYLFDHRLAMGSVVAAHALVILGPTALKIGYVMRLLAERNARFAYQAKLTGCN
ncbi:hypothetical protein N7335_21085 [Stutzerimonas stutzeri]|uniref:Transmembrane sensor/regulator PpyR n=2 Tax=Stutzerimonas stutzeri TaxID=316 RepID=A0AA42HFY8_STUST|nr:hypothetical protein [Stutzerimonas stutzeri]MDH0153103.1 hypothetical protein [Stutzerimonas stutzeri]MDH0156057.1 hypothetical protein [Stutzerimonas stutzeri]MDH0611348.1 hypothetical protein [Stutzerimonas stutzeri]MDH1555162.1 hypothetical protein [Stutzerimonas stutzeri]